MILFVAERRPACFAGAHSLSVCQSFIHTRIEENWRGAQERTKRTHTGWNKEAKKLYHTISPTIYLNSVVKKTKIYGKAELLACGMIHGESSMAAADKKLKDDFAVLWRVVAFLHVINRHLFFPYQLVDFASIPCQIRLAVGECVCFWNFAAATGDKLNSHFHHQCFRIEFHWELWPSQFNFKLLVRLLATHFNLRQFHFDKSCFLLWREWNSQGTRLMRRHHFSNWLWIFHLCAIHWLARL